MKKFVMLMVLASVMILSSVALVAAQEEKAAEEQQLDMTTFTCREFLEVFDTDAFVTELLVMWAHGYSGAHDAVDLEKYPLSKSGLEKFLNELIDVCGEDETKLFIPAVVEMD